MFVTAESLKSEQYQPIALVNCQHLHLGVTLSLKCQNQPQLLFTGLFNQFHVNSNCGA